MNVRLFALTAALSFSGCLCAGPPVGECNGTWGGVTYNKVQIDPNSRVVVVAKPSCVGKELKRYEIAWGEPRLALNASTFGGPALLTGEQTFAVPPQTGQFVSFSVTPVELPAATGELKLGLNGFEARTGKLTLTSATESLICSFDVHTVNEGIPPKCGGSSGGGDGD